MTYTFFYMALHNSRCCSSNPVACINKQQLSICSTVRKKVRISGLKSRSAVWSLSHSETHFSSALVILCSSVGHFETKTLVCLLKCEVCNEMSDAECEWS